MNSNITIRRTPGNRIVLIDDENAGIEIIQRNGSRHLGLFDQTDRNLALVSRHRWYLHEGYLCSEDETGREIYLTWLLYGRPPNGFIWHHLNGRLDNRSENLRMVPFSLNNYAKPVQKNRTTGIRGVSRYKDGGYVALVGLGGKRKSFKEKEEAISARQFFQRKMEELILQAPKPSNESNLFKAYGRTILKTGKNRPAL